MITSYQQIIKKCCYIAFLSIGTLSHAQTENPISESNPTESLALSEIAIPDDTEGIFENTLASNLPVTTIQRHVVPNSINKDAKDSVICKEIELAISFDEYPEDISWTIVDSNNNLVAKADRYNSFPRQKVLAMKQCLTPGTYTFIIKDKNEDGLCCKQSRGFYHLYINDGTSLASGASFGSRETTIFTINDPEYSESDVSIDRVLTTEQIQYSIFPNPAQSGDLLQIVAPGTVTQYTIYNRLGKIAQKGQLQQNAINVDALESGRYLVEINVNNRPTVLDFVKN